MQKFSQDGHKFLILRSRDGWTWAVTTMTGEVEATGICPSKAAAAACIVRATISRIAPAPTHVAGLERAA